MQHVLWFNYCTNNFVYKNVSFVNIEMAGFYNVKGL